MKLSVSSSLSASLVSLPYALSVCHSISPLSHTHTTTVCCPVPDLVPSGHAHQPLALFLRGWNCVSSPGWESLGCRWVPLSQESNAQQLHCCQGLSAESLWGLPGPRQLSPAHLVFSELMSAQHQGWVLGQLSSLSYTSLSLQGTILLPNLASVLCDPECWESP